MTLFVLMVCYMQRSVANTTTQSGETALILTAAEGHPDCVRLLVEAGAGTESKTNVRYVILSFRVSVFTCVRRLAFIFV